MGSNPPRACRLGAAPQPRRRRWRSGGQASPARRLTAPARSAATAVACIVKTTWQGSQEGDFRESCVHELGVAMGGGYLRRVAAMPGSMWRSGQQACRQRAGQRVVRRPAGTLNTTNPTAAACARAEAGLVAPLPATSPCNTPLTRRLQSCTHTSVGVRGACLQQWWGADTDERARGRARRRAAGLGSCSRPGCALRRPWRRTAGLL